MQRNETGDSEGDAAGSVSPSSGWVGLADELKVAESRRQLEHHEGSCAVRSAGGAWAGTPTSPGGDRQRRASRE